MQQPIADTRLESQAMMFLLLLLFAIAAGLAFRILRQQLLHRRRPAWYADLGSLLAHTAAGLFLLALIVIELVVLALDWQDTASVVGLLTLLVGLAAVVGLLIRRDYRRLTGGG